MKKHSYRTLLIYAVVIGVLIQIYPTLGWMVLSPEQRQDRLEQWADEDGVYHEPALFAEMGRAMGRWAQFDRDQVINLGLDLQGDRAPLQEKLGGLSGPLERRADHAGEVHPLERPCHLPRLSLTPLGEPLIPEALLRHGTVLGVSDEVELHAT